MKMENIKNMVLEAIALIFLNILAMMYDSTLLQFVLLIDAGLLGYHINDNVKYKNANKGNGGKNDAWMGKKIDRT